MVNTHMDVMETIYRGQVMRRKATRKAPPHEPEMLYIGCIDARLDPTKDLEIPKGKVLIFRNIAALVAKSEAGSQTVDPKSALANGEIPQNVSIGAAIEFFMNRIPQKKGVVKHIVISGHTDCGGIKACLSGQHESHEHYLPLYLSNLNQVREKVIERAKAGKFDEEQTLRLLEQESVRYSLINLLTYPAVRKAVDAGTLKIHGWVIDTGAATEIDEEQERKIQCISEINLITGEFERVGKSWATGAAARGGR